jgi:hypothetical protein
MNLNLNPKVCHILAEIVQGCGIVTTVASLPGLSLVAPWVGVVAGTAAGLSTIIKTYYLTGNVPPTPAPPVAPAPSTSK